MVPVPNSTDFARLKPDGVTIRLSLHSPVKIDLYDTSNKHTGISTSSTPDFTLFEEQIPNSYYLEFGEGKYLGMSSSSIPIPNTLCNLYTVICNLRYGR